MKSLLYIFSEEAGKFQYFFGIKFFVCLLMAALWVSGISEVNAQEREQITWRQALKQEKD